MKRTFIRICLLAAAVAVLGLFSAASAQSVGGSIAGGAVTRGKAAKATAYLSLPAGLHANSNRPNSEYAIPTTVKASGKGVTIGPVSYPRGHNRKFEFSENSINVYEGRVSFGFNVTVPAGYRGDTVKVNVSIKYQACTNAVCYAPKTKSLTLMAKVR